MDGGGFKVPVAALGRRKKASEKSQATDDHTEERDSKATQSPDEARPELGGDREVSTSGACASSDRDGQNSDAGLLDRGATAAETYSRVKGDKISRDTADLPVDIGSPAREGAPSSECDIESSDSNSSGRESSNDKRSHDMSSRQRPTKSAESASNSGSEGSVPRLPYTVPHWSGEPPRDQTFSLSVIKNGTIIDELGLSGKAYLVFGRLPSCDVPLEHPSISRHHAVLQYRPASQDKKEGEGESENHTVFSTNPHDSGYYVYDLGSTHGTYLNKKRLDQRCYHRVRVGQMLKFGGSSRLFLLEVNCTVY